MVKRSGPPSQGWRTFLRNHLPQTGAIDLFVVPTIGFNLLYVLVLVRLARRELVWINVTAYPTAEWIAQQITEAFPWNEAPRYLIRDREGLFQIARRLLLAAQSESENTKVPQGLCPIAGFGDTLCRLSFFVYRTGGQASLGCVPPWLT